MVLDISTFIDISTTISVGGTPRQTFGRGLMLTPDETLSAGGSGKVELFNTLNAVSTRFGSGDVVDGASVWFSADPSPEALYVGRWATANVNTSLTGATPAVVTAFTAANYSFAINGTNVTPIDLSTPNTYTAFATAIQTALAATTGFSGATVTFAGGVFVITLAGSDAINPPYLTAAVDPTTQAQIGVDLVPLMAMGQSDNPTYIQGQNQESAVDALTECVNNTVSNPIAIMLAPDAPLIDPVTGNDTRSDVAAWAQAGDYMFGLRDTAAQALVTNDSTSESALAFSRNQGKVLSTFDNAGGRPEIAGLAMLSAQNLNNRATIITLHNKPAPGVAASTVTATQYAELERKRVNIVTGYAGATVMLGGFTSRAGYWADAQWWVLWLKNEMELAVATAQRGSRRLTSAILTNAVTGIMQVGIRNGGIQQGGQVNAQTRSDIISFTGNDDFNGTLSTGYVLWVESPSVRTDTDRSNRIGRFRAWIAPSEAIHSVMGDIVLSG